MRMFVRMFVATRFAEEGQEHQTPAIERCEQCCYDQHPEGIAHRIRRKRTLDHSILGREASETDPTCKWNTNTCDRQRAN